MAKTYTQAEVDAMLAAQNSVKPIAVTPKSGISKKGPRAGKPYSGIQVTGNFPPVYLSRNVALALSDDATVAKIRAALALPVPAAS